MRRSPFGQQERHWKSFHWEFWSKLLTSKPFGQRRWEIVSATLTFRTQGILKSSYPSSVLLFPPFLCLLPLPTQSYFYIALEFELVLRARCVLVSLGCTSVSRSVPFGPTRDKNGTPKRVLVPLGPIGHIFLLCSVSASRFSVFSRLRRSTFKSLATASTRFFQLHPSSQQSLFHNLLEMKSLLYPSLG